MSEPAFKFTSPWDSLLHLVSEHRGSVWLSPCPKKDFPKGWRLSAEFEGIHTHSEFCCGELPLPVGLNQAAERVLDGMRARLATFAQLAADVDEVSP